MHIHYLVVLSICLSSTARGPKTFRCSPLLETGRVARLGTVASSGAAIRIRSPLRVLIIFSRVVAVRLDSLFSFRK